MALARSSQESVAEQIQRDSDFTTALLQEAATVFLNREPETARLILRGVVNATLSFEALAAETTESLLRMLLHKGNPKMEHLATIFGAVCKSLNKSSYSGAGSGNLLRQRYHLLHGSLWRARSYSDCVSEVGELSSPDLTH